MLRILGSDNLAHPSREDTHLTYMSADREASIDGKFCIGVCLNLT